MALHLMIKLHGLPRIFRSVTRTTLHLDCMGIVCVLAFMNWETKYAGKENIQISHIALKIECHLVNLDATDA